MSGSTLDLLRHERIVLALTLTAVTALSWLYLVRMVMSGAGMAHGGVMSMGDGATMPPPGSAAVLFTMLMWSVMMVGMMLPTAAPAILVFDAANRRHATVPRVLPGYLFAAGYLVAWLGFSLVVALAQTALQRLALLSPGMALARPELAGAVLVAAGVFQWTPAKSACLRHCRSPFGLVATGWPRTKRGVFRLGVKLGLFCIGCCWALMALMFVGGVMNLLWMVLIAGVVLVEKVARGGAHFARAVGLGLVCGGGWLLLV